MNRHRASLTSAALALAAACLLPSVAQAKITELGALADGVRGSCPGIAAAKTSCQAISRTTGYQAKVGPDRTLYRAPADGRIVAWSLSLGKPSPAQTAFFEGHYGGVAKAAVVVLDPGKSLSRRVVAKAPLQTLTSYFGSTVQFPLERSLPVSRGQYVGLTVPSWAPALQLGVGADTSWRSSRGSCNNPLTQSALLGSRSSAQFRCLYKTARMAYSATFISLPSAP
jgi:hypothetical protein